MWAGIWAVQEYTEELHCFIMNTVKQMFDFCIFFDISLATVW